MTTLLALLSNWEILSPALIVAWSFVMMALERAFPYDRQKFLREGIFVDFFWYTLVHSYVMGLVIKAVISWMDSRSGLSRLHLVTDWPPWGQFLFFWVTHDFYIYWFHRLQHNNKYLWRVHEAHHSVKEVDWVAGSRSHALEILINQTIEYAPIVLLGAHPDMALMKGTLDAVWGMYIHSNINVKSGWVQYVFNGPEMHRWHHSNHLSEGGINYSTKISIWDWLFGTAYLPKGEKPPAYGLSGGVEFPGVGNAKAQSVVGKFVETAFDYARQHAYAFRSFGRDTVPVEAEVHRGQQRG